MHLTATDFGIEIEISAEISRHRKLRMYELGITYFGRTYVEGKKINWKDGVKALWYVFEFPVFVTTYGERLPENTFGRPEHFHHVAFGPRTRPSRRHPKALILCCIFQQPFGDA